MATLKVLAEGSSSASQGSAKGRLFEALMREVLRQKGYVIDKCNVNYAGMEIDIEGHHELSGIPLYAECKAYTAEVDAPKLQAFFGKYMMFWLQNKKTHGAFIALPGLNSHAKGLFNEHCRDNEEITLSLLEEAYVLESIYGTKIAVRPEVISAALPSSFGSAAESTLVYTEKGIFWLQYVTLPQKGVPSAVALFDGHATLLNDGAIFEYLSELLPELRDLRLLSPDAPVVEDKSEAEEIVEVRGSSACFEYQFPASPEFFFGREPILKELDTFTNAVIEGQTSARGFLVEANSGWGKSSLILSSVAKLRQSGHFAVAIDCRSASTSQFLLRVANYVLTQLADNGLDVETSVNGYTDAIDKLVRASELLKADGKLLAIFFDQFENLFVLQDALKRITELVLKVCDIQANVIVGFAWKSDLVSVTTDFPYEQRDLIKGVSKSVALPTFSDVETTALVDRLEKEIKVKLRSDLRFLLTDFSQGYPWLLKKLCAHVKSQHEAGVLQAEIAANLLRVDELFQEDMRGLSQEEEGALRQIAKVVPISSLDLAEEIKPDIIQSLVNQRLVVRIGPKLDIYWDLFRDYLTGGGLPVQEHYVLRLTPSSVMKAVKLLGEAGGRLDITAFQDEAHLSQNSLYNVLRDMRVLGLAQTKGSFITVADDLRIEGRDFWELLREHLRDRLQRNRLSARLIERLQAKGSLTLEEVGKELAAWCPYISASAKTWRFYARVFADWLDFADLGTFTSNSALLTEYVPGSEVRRRNLLSSRRRGGVLPVPSIQYRPIEKILVRLIDSLRSGSLDVHDIPPSTVRKCFLAIVDLGFAERREKGILLTPFAREFVRRETERPKIFASMAVKMQVFKIFVEILEANSVRMLTDAELGVELNNRLSMGWTVGTAKTNAKIMLDWARNCELAPERYQDAWHKGRRRAASRYQPGLFRAIVDTS